jgi:L-asparaginase
MQQPVKIKTAAHGPQASSLLIIYTGGTFGMAYDSEGRLMKPFDFGSILEKLPELNRFEMELTFVSLDHPMDSSNFNCSHWLEMAGIVYENYDAFDGFVILHGTDTMAYSASALSFLLENLNKPVIFTGAQLPIGIARTDARENFITALEIASAKESGRPLVREVCIYFDYYLLRGNRSKKLQSNHFDAFVSENYPVLAEAGVSIEYNHAAIQSGFSAGMINFKTGLDSDIAVIKLFPGMQEKYFSSVFDVPGLKAVLLETYGSGNAPDYPWLIRCVEKAIRRGIVIFNVSQCVGGKVIQGKYETSRMLQDAGVISGGNITFEAAVAKLMFVLAQPEYSGNASEMLAQPLRGEMDRQF